MKSLTVLGLMGLTSASAALAAGSINVNTTAKMNGTYGMQVNLPAAADQAWVQDNSPVAEGVYRASFWFNPGYTGDAPTFSEFPPGNAHIIFQAMGPNPDGGPGNAPVLEIEVRRYGTASNTVRVRALCYYDNQVSPKRLATAMIALQPDQFHQLQLEWEASSSNVTADGFCRLSVIGGPQTGQTEEVANAVKDKRHAIEFVRLGGIKGVDTNSNGPNFFDDFASYRSLAP